ncbi:hypothetical protein AVEN_262353-1 [Araneus ventricosus]|uniref:Uncharacterized protein n=1 Tax=Araneus ventricosus TaxID=182803 RepID=A0A4Y2Q2I2_ARAVE|nr:hypothetical protein AVEN_262353-1 [Araneus ventricosus]
MPSLKRRIIAVIEIAAQKMLQNAERDCLLAVCRAVNGAHTENHSFFFSTFVPIGIINFYYLVLLGKFPSLLVLQLLECPRQWTSILHTLAFAYLQEVQ